MNEFYNFRRLKYLLDCNLTDAKKVIKENDLVKKGLMIRFTRINTRAERWKSTRVEYKYLKENETQILNIINGGF